MSEQEKKPDEQEEEKPAEEKAKKPRNPWTIADKDCAYELYIEMKASELYSATADSGRQGVAGIEAYAAFHRRAREILISHARKADKLGDFMLPVLRILVSRFLGRWEHRVRAVARSSGDSPIRHELQQEFDHLNARMKKVCDELARISAPDAMDDPETLTLTHDLYQPWEPAPAPVAEPEPVAVGADGNPIIGPDGRPVPIGPDGNPVLQDTAQIGAFQ